MPRYDTYRPPTRRRPSVCVHGEPIGECDRGACDEGY